MLRHDAGELPGVEIVQIVSNHEDLRHVAEHFDTAPELAARAFNRPRRSTLQEAVVTGPRGAKALKKAMREGTAQYEELSKREDRAKSMATVLAHQEVERNMRSKGRKRKVRDASGDQPAVYKWKKERQR